LTDAVSNDWRTLYPFASHFLSLPSHRLHYLDEGSGEPILCVHGNPTWSFYWRNIVLAFRARQRVVVPDHLGCGLSDKPQEYSYTLKQHIENLLTLIRELNLSNITLVAHDWGGAIGLGAAVQAPERFSRFVLMNTAAFRSSRCPWRIRACRVPGLGEYAVRKFNAFARAAIWMATARKGGLPAPVANGLLAPYDTWEHRVAVQRFVEDIPLDPDHPSYETLRSIEVALPTLADKPWQFIWGMQDWCFTHHYLDRFLEIIPQARVRRLYDAGHYIMEDARERVIHTLQEFLQIPADVAK
jgi:haloalkane dehalogenase